MVPARRRAMHGDEAARVGTFQPHMAGALMARAAPVIGDQGTDRRLPVAGIDVQLVPGGPGQQNGVNRGVIRHLFLTQGQPNRCVMARVARSGQRKNIRPLPQAPLARLECGKSGRISMTPKLFHLLGGAALVFATALSGAAQAQTAQWQPESPLPFERSEAAAAAVGGRVYVISGNSRGNQANSFVHELEPQTSEWRERAMMPGVSSHAGAATLNGKIY